MVTTPISRTRVLIASALAPKLPPAERPAPMVCTGTVSIGRTFQEMIQLELPSEVVATGAPLVVFATGQLPFLLKLAIVLHGPVAATSCARKSKAIGHSTIFVHSISTLVIKNSCRCAYGWERKPA